MELLPYGTNVKVDSKFGIVVSISRENYGVKFGNGEVAYYPHRLVLA